MKTQNRIKIVFADDHAVVRDGLRTLFKSDPGLWVMGEASNGEEIVKLIEKVHPDVAILDISMPGLNGIEATKLIREKVPKTKILILTIHENEEFVYEMIYAGANGYLLKNAEKKEIIQAVKSIASGEPFFSPSVSRLILQGFVNQSQRHPQKIFDTSRQLTKREKEILNGIVEGLTSKEIAEKLNISFSTVNSHRTNIMKKLDIHDMASLVRYAIENKVITPGS